MALPPVRSYRVTQAPVPEWVRSPLADVSEDVSSTSTEVSSSGT